MEITFEQQKNMKALALTIGLHGLLFVLFFYIAFQQPIPPSPIPQEGFEVNLGNSESGLGDEAPQAKEAPGPATEESENGTTASSQENATVEKSEDDIETTTIKKTNQNKKDQSVALNNNPKDAKAVYKGSKGMGGNDADSYNKSRNQGIAGGNGDQGNPNGNINSKSYSGNSANGNGVSIIEQGFSGRKAESDLKFRDEFNENATITLNIRIDANGNVISATIKRTTTSNEYLRRIALQRGKQVKFQKGSGEATGVLTFRFRLEE